MTNDFPPGKVLRTAVLAAALAKAAGYDAEAQRDAYWVSLLRFLGCTGFAHEEAHVYGGGNDHSVRWVMALADATNPAATVTSIARKVGQGAPPLARARAVARLLGDREAPKKHARAQCDTSLRFASMLSMPDRLKAALDHVCERFDGRGEPAGIAGEGIALATRLLHVADVAELAHHRLGEEAAREELRRRAGKHLDPALVRALLANGPPLFAVLGATNVWQRFLDAEPGEPLTADGKTAVARAFALFADLKTVHTLTHSTRVAELAAGAARAAGLAADDVTALEHAALLHDVGRVAVPNAIWDRPTPLDDAAWERVRLHAYYTDRVLARAPAWADAARLASAAHERLDGDGYHRGLGAASLGRAARILAAADVMAALTEPRPHREAMAATAAADELGREVKAGRLDASAVDAVVAAAGLGRRSTTAWPKGLSDREVDVLRHLARGKTNKEIGLLLGISPRTVQNHVAHAYDKLGVYSRAGAALFVTEHGLLD